MKNHTLYIFNIKACHWQVFLPLASYPPLCLGVINETATLSGCNVAKLVVFFFFFFTTSFITDTNKGGGRKEHSKGRILVCVQCVFSFAWFLNDMVSCGHADRIQTLIISSMPTLVCPSPALGCSSSALSAPPQGWRLPSNKPSNQ